MYDLTSIKQEWLCPLEKLGRQEVPLWQTQAAQTCPRRLNLHRNLPTSQKKQSIHKIKWKYKTIFLMCSMICFWQKENQTYHEIMKMWYKHFLFRCFELYRCVFWGGFSTAGLGCLGMVWAGLNWDAWVCRGGIHFLPCFRGGPNHCCLIDVISYMCDICISYQT
jgi:hypothetical protein